MGKPKATFAEYRARITALSPELRLYLKHCAEGRRSADGQNPFKLSGKDGTANRYIRDRKTGTDYFGRPATVLKILEEIESGNPVEEIAATDGPEMPRCSGASGATEPSEIAASLVKMTELDSGGRLQQPEPHPCASIGIPEEKGKATPVDVASGIESDEVPAPAIQSAGDFQQSGSSDRQLLGPSRNADVRVLGDGRAPVAGPVAIQRGNLHCRRAAKIWLRAFSDSVWSIPFLSAAIAAVGVFLAGIVRNSTPAATSAVAAAMPPMSPPAESLPAPADLLRLLEQRGKLGLLFAALCRASASSAFLRRDRAGDAYAVIMGHRDQTGAILAQGLVPLRPHPGSEDLALWRLCAYNVSRVELRGETLMLVPADMTEYQQNLRSVWQSSGIRLGELWCTLELDRVVVREGAQ